MAKNTVPLEQRLARLEELFWLILLLEIGPEFPEASKAMFRFPRPPHREDISALLSRGGFPRRYEEIKERLHYLENLIQEGQLTTRHLSERVLEFRGLMEGLEARSEERVQNVRSHVREVFSEQQILKEELHTYLIAGSLGLDLDHFPFRRYVPIRVYLSEDTSQKIESISSALSALSDSFGFEFSDDFPSEAGSWFKKWFSRAKEAVTQPEMLERLQKVERGLEMAALNKPQSEIDQNQAKAAALLLRALSSVPNAVCQVGSVLVVKKTDQKNKNPQVVVQTLTSSQMIKLEKEQTLIRSPETLLQSLSEFDEAKTKRPVRKISLQDDI